MQQNSKRNIKIALLGLMSVSVNGQVSKAPNVVFILADEWRAQDLGYNGNVVDETETVPYVKINFQGLPIK